MLGDFNVSNATAAFAVAVELGMAIETVQQGLASARPVPGRMEAVGREIDGTPSVFVDYAHTPEALERALSTLRPLTDGRLIVVFGCGGDRDRGKRGPMGRAAVAGADVVFVTSDNPRSEQPGAIIEEIVEGIRTVDVSASERVRVVPKRGEAISAAIAEASLIDTVLIAGKGHETYQEIDGRRREFDDVARATQALLSRDSSATPDEEAS
jgi:UDP-N-acetylmuramyl-tripeptide synthetase